MKFSGYPFLSSIVVINSNSLCIPMLYSFIPIFIFVVFIHPIHYSFQFHSLCIPMLYCCMHSNVVIIILENIFTNGVKDFNGLSKLQLKKLLLWTTKGTIQFQGKLYEQTDGVAMGSPIAPLLADVCTNCIFDQASPLLDHNTVLIRYVDDIFCVASNQAVFDNIFRILSSIHSSIQFSQEIEQHHQLSFLDVLLTRNGNTLQTSVYRKTTHTGLYTKWTSLCPLKFKRNLINCLLHRAYTICSSYIGMHKEFEFITTMLLKNGYPLNFIQTQICRFLDIKHQISNSKPPDKNLRRMIFKLPYIGNASVALGKRTSKFLSSQIR